MCSMTTFRLPSIRWCGICTRRGRTHHRLFRSEEQESNHVIALEGACQAQILVES